MFNKFKRKNKKRETVMKNRNSNIEKEENEINFEEIERISKEIMDYSKLEQEKEDKIIRRNSLKRMIPMKKRNDRLAQFIKGKRNLKLSELFTFYNPNNPKLMFLMIDYFNRCSFDGKKTWYASDVVSYKQLRSFYYENYELDLRKCGDDINLISLQVFTGEVNFSNLVVNKEILKEKWNIETIAMLEYKNDFTVKIK